MLPGTTPGRRSALETFRESISETVKLCPQLDEKLPGEGANVTRLLPQRPRVPPEVPRAPPEGIRAGVYAGLVHFSPADYVFYAASGTDRVRGVSPSDWRDVDATRGARHLRRSPR